MSSRIANKINHRLDTLKNNIEDLKDDTGFELLAKFDDDAKAIYRGSGDNPWEAVDIDHVESIKTNLGQIVRSGVGVVQAVGLAGVAIADLNLPELGAAIGYPVLMAANAGKSVFDIALHSVLLGARTLAQPFQ